MHRLVERFEADYACVQRLLAEGLVEQAGTIASAMFEIAWSAVYVLLDNRAAERWEAHADPKRPAFSAWEACLEGLRLLGHPDAERQVRIEYDTYRRLCWFKHGSPLVDAAGLRDFVVEQVEHLRSVVMRASEVRWAAGRR